MNSESPNNLLQFNNDLRQLENATSSNGSDIITTITRNYPNNDTVTEFQSHYGSVKINIIYFSLFIAALLVLACILIFISAKWNVISEVGLLVSSKDSNADDKPHLATKSTALSTESPLEFEDDEVSGKHEPLTHLISKEGKNGYHVIANC